MAPPSPVSSTAAAGLRDVGVTLRVTGAAAGQQRTSIDGPVRRYESRHRDVQGLLAVGGAPRYSCGVQEWAKNTGGYRFGSLSIRWFAALCLISGTAQASYRSDFVRALGALIQGEWREVELLTENAIAKERFAQALIIDTDSHGPVAYTPHLLLGIALYEQGDCPAAVRSLEFSNAQGVAQRTESVLWERGALALSVCSARTVRAAQSLLEAALARGEVELKEWRRLEEVGTALEKLAGPPDLLERAERGARTLASAEDLLGLGQATEQELDAATVSVAAATEQLRYAVSELRTTVQVTMAGRIAQVGSDLEAAESLATAFSEGRGGQLMEQDQTALRDARRELLVARQEFDAAADSGELSGVDRVAERVAGALQDLRDIEARAEAAEANRSLEQETDALRAELSLLERRRQRLSPSSVSATVGSRITSVDRRLSQIRTELGAEGGGSLAGARALLQLVAADLDTAEAAAEDRGLKEAADAYLRGRYALSLQLIAEYGSCGTESSGSTGLRRCVLEAASAYALLRRSAEASEEGTRRVAELVTRIRELDPTYRPSAELFSPSFRSLFEPRR